MKPQYINGDDVTAEDTLSLICSQSDCNGYMKLDDQEAFNASDDMVVIPMKCVKCGYMVCVNIDVIVPE